MMIARDIGSFVRGALNDSLAPSSDKIMRAAIERLNGVSDIIIADIPPHDELAHAIEQVAHAL